MPDRVLVIGSGFGGLAAAVRLAARGYQVELFEKRERPGGRAYVYELDGFRFDGGPTIITAPFMFDELFALAGRRRSDYVQFHPCDPFYRIFDHEGRHFDYGGDTGQILRQIEQWNPADREGYLRFLERTRAIFQKGFVELADQPFLRVSDMLRVVPDLIRLQSYKSVYRYVSQYISNDFLRRCFSFHPLLVGGNPFDAPSIYALIHYLEREWGVHYVMGGTGALVEALVRLIEELGGRVHLGTAVEEILVRGRRAVGLRLADGTIVEGEQIVCNADVAYSYLKLLPARSRRRNPDWRYTRLTRYSMSLFVLYFATKRRYTDAGLVHHNIILGERYRELLHDIFRGKHLAEDFSLYLHVPSLTDPTLAPPGHELFYVLSPVPHLGSGIDWQAEAPRYREAILAFLEARYLPGLREHLVVQHHIDPLHFRDTLNSHLGSAFSIEPILTQSAWFRPHNRSEDIDNLYFVGAGTHPGAGLPGVLSSAVIAEKLILSDGCP